VVTQNSSCRSKDGVTCQVQTAQLLTEERRWVYNRVSWTFLTFQVNKNMTKSKLWLAIMSHKTKMLPIAYPHINWISVWNGSRHWQATQLCLISIFVPNYSNLWLGLGLYLTYCCSKNRITSALGWLMKAE
jgi:hypothetical protein